MNDQSGITNEQARRNVVEQMWLNYFNNTLLEQGIITAEQHRKMCVRIATRKPAGVTNRTNRPELE